MIAIVIVNYRTPRLVVDCLRSLELEVKELSDTQVWVVDGGSGDGSARLLADAIRERGWSDWVSLLPLDLNGGFAYANNAALRPLLARELPPDYVYLLNPDTVIFPGALRELVAFLDAHPRAGLAGSQCENADGSVRRTAFRFPSLFGELESEARIGPLSRLLAPWVVAPPPPHSPARCDWVSGAAVLVRREVFDTVGLLDDGFFLYYEETEFAGRAADAGFECWIVPQSRIVHYCGQSTGVTQADGSLRDPPPYVWQSRRRYFATRHGRAYAWAADAAAASGRLLYWLRPW